MNKKILFLITLISLIYSKDLNKKYIYSYIYIVNDNIYKNILLFDIKKNKKDFYLQKKIYLDHFLDKERIKLFKKYIYNNKKFLNNLNNIGCKFLKEKNLKNTKIIIDYNVFKIEKKIKLKNCIKN